MDRHRRTAAKPSGFTLIELLVVISIVTLLIALLLPALQKSLSVAKSAACLSNLRQISITARSYSGDHHGYAAPVYAHYNSSPTGVSSYTVDDFPDHIQGTFGKVRGTASSFDHWLALGYVSGGGNYRNYKNLPGNDMFTCPGMVAEHGPISEVSWNNNWGGITESHYSILAICLGPRASVSTYPPRSKNYLGAYSLDDFLVPAKAILLADSRWSEQSDGSFALAGMFTHLAYPLPNYRDHVEAYVGRGMKFPGSGIIWEHRFWVHGQGANAAYADGHAATLPGEWQMTQEHAMKDAATVDNLGW